MVVVVVVVVVVVDEEGAGLDGDFDLVVLFGATMVLKSLSLLVLLSLSDIESFIIVLRLMI